MVFPRLQLLGTESVLNLFRFWENLSLFFESRLRVTSAISLSKHRESLWYWSGGCIIIQRNVLKKYKKPQTSNQFYQYRKQQTCSMKRFGFATNQKLLKPKTEISVDIWILDMKLILMYNTSTIYPMASWGAIFCPSLSHFPFPNE